MHSIGNSTLFINGLARTAVVALALALYGCIGDGGSPASSGGEEEATAPPSGLPVTISNQSSHTVHVLITGDSSQTFSVSPKTDSIPALGSKTFSVTNVSVGRIYLSYDTALSSSAPDGANPGDKDYHTRFDKVEITYNQGTGGSVNLTAVDFYAIPMVLETSIQGTVINHLTLTPGQTGSALATAIGTAVAANQNAPVVNTKAGAFARVLSPVKAPAPYGSFDGYLGTLGSATLTISGTYFGTPSQPYNYTGTFGANNITLTNGTHTIKVPLSSLMYSATDLIDHDGIYTCDAPYTVDGTTHHVADNDVYAAVYRDLVTGFNLGFVQPGANTSSAWWTSAPFPSNSFSGTYYNAYAQVVANNYPGAYGFPFSDRYKQVLADLGGMVDAVTVTVLGDNTPAPSYTPQGNLNPQTSTPGSPTINVVLVTADNNFNQTTFNFDLQSFQGGNVYTFPTTVPTTTTSNDSAQINAIPVQNGLNIYTLQLRGKQYSVLANVSNGVVVWASIAGGGNATWSSPNLFIGGLN